MRKVVLALVCLLTMQSLAWAEDAKSIQVNQLPKAAQTFIRQHFPGRQVALAKLEAEWFDKCYDVIFTNGDKVEFDRKGEWTEVNCRYSVVPVQVVPAAITKYVKQHYPKASILLLERDRHEFVVKLSDGWELTFDRDFQLLDIDK